MTEALLDKDDTIIDNSKLKRQLEKVMELLKAKHGEAVYNSWLKNIEIGTFKGKKVVLSAPTRFIREWIVSHYMEDIKNFWGIIDERIKTYEIEINTAATPEGYHPENVRPKSKAVVSESVQINDNSDGAPLDPRYTFDNFVVGKTNSLAHAAAKKVSEAQGVAIGCNPLFLYGGVGLGKTHLMHAIAWEIRRRDPGRKVVYLSAEKFMYQFVQALRNKEALEFKERFRSVDVLMIDDVQFISGKESTQEEFFHTFNALVDQNKQLVISSDRSPNDLDDMEERVRSRLGWGLVANIHKSDYELRLGILQSKLEQIPNVKVPLKVLEFLAHKITSNIRELEGALNRVVAHATLVGRQINLDTCQEVLHDILKANDRRITVEEIQKSVAGHYNIRVSDMFSARRSIAVARPRQVAMYLAKKHTSKSLPEIGRRFGGKDHTTVIHAVRKIEELSKIDAEFAQDVELLGKMIQR